jgi:hypothetical protein
VQPPGFSGSGSQLRSTPPRTQREHGEHDAAATHSLRDGRHIVKVDDRVDTTTRDLSESLWHELIHAMQSEADPDFQKSYAAESAARGYDENSYEVEANELRTSSHPGWGWFGERLPLPR